MHEITIDMKSSLDSHTVENIIKQFVESSTGKAVSIIESIVVDGEFKGVSVMYHSEKPVVAVNQTDKPKEAKVFDKTFKPLVY